MKIVSVLFTFFFVFSFEANANIQKQSYSISALTCMARTLNGEARGEGYKGMLMVARVIMNRAKNNPEKVCEIVRKNRRGVNQFDGYWVGRTTQRALSISRKVLSEGDMGRYDHFHATYVNPYWARVYRSRGCEIERHGKHIFYRACERMRVSKNKRRQNGRRVASQNVAKN